jgi:hypothetical protein
MMRDAGCEAETNANGLENVMRGRASRISHHASGVMNETKNTSRSGKTLQEDQIWKD